MRAIPSLANPAMPIFRGSADFLYLLVQGRSLHRVVVRCHDHHSMSRDRPDGHTLTAIRARGPPARDAPRHMPSGFPVPSLPVHRSQVEALLACWFWGGMLQLARLPAKPIALLRLKLELLP
jgi:hypothetical protein